MAGGSPTLAENCGGGGYPRERSLRRPNQCCASSSRGSPSTRRYRQRGNSGGGRQVRSPGTGRARSEFARHGACEAASVREREARRQARSYPVCMTGLTGVRLSNSPLGPTQNIWVMDPPSQCVGLGTRVQPGDHHDNLGPRVTISWRVWTI